MIVKSAIANVINGGKKMEYSMQEKYVLIKNAIMKEDSLNPIIIAKNVMKNNFVSIHGPEHHFLDGASFLKAIYNSKPFFDLDYALDELANRSIKMPGAMCGYWGICGSVASIGAALSVLHKTGPLSNDQFYKEHMEYTSSVIKIMSKVCGPRCCKRNAFISISEGIKFIKEKYGIELEIEKISCDFSSFNKQCIKSKCPFHKDGE